MEKERNKVLILCAAAFCIIGGLQFSVLKVAMALFENNIMFLWVRFFIAYAGIFIYARLKKICLPKDRGIIILSVLHPFTAFYLQTVGAAECDVTVISVITSIFPAIAALLAFFSGEESLTVKGWFAMTGIVAGGLVCAFFGYGAGDFFTAGTFYLFLSIVLRAVYYVAVHRMSSRFSGYEISYGQITYAFSGYTLLVILSGRFDISFVEALTPYGVFSLLYMGLLATSVSYMLNNYLLSHLPVSAGGAIAAVTFLINLFAAAFVSGESLNIWIYAGSAAIITSIIVLAQEKRQNEHKF